MLVSQWLYLSKPHHIVFAFRQSRIDFCGRRDGKHYAHANYRGPGKYDGSVVNWINGPLLAAIGSRRGVEVSFQSFSYRSAANVLTLTARVRE